ncbi:Alpha/beta hydrolase [Amycolatopsis xylanica]|uniref:Alpha/beta hydrolase n=1 Tax=Amycolatopsis xylanica TaxID=589385 RepID=A0A1H3HL42_9PSEU|nr:alpha/beta hydrolase [Amycolatopsis xylanica]SDY16177.1 Alpha/beta hydrolase [Amycolatopsis xylanica]
MVSWGDVRQWNAGAIGGVADSLNQRCTTLIASNDDVERAIVREGWLGAAAVAAGQRGRVLISGLEQRVAEASAVRRAAHEVQLAVERISSFVRETDELARSNGWFIGTDGALVLLPTAGHPPPPEVVARQNQVKIELLDRIEQLLRRATDVDADFAAILTKAMRGEITEQDATSLAQAADAGDRQSGLSIIGPPEGGTPGDNKAWWASLSDTAKGVILRDNPDLVRNLDGIPIVDRDAANRAVLHREIGKLEAEASALARGNPNSSRVNNPVDWPGKEKLDAVLGKLDGLRAIDARLNHPAGGQSQAFLIGLDVTGDGKAIVSAGNPDTARNVATYVPGTGAGLAGMADEMTRADRMVDAAHTADSPSTAVIAWVGYDAPNEVVPNAISASYADAAKKDLDSFQDGLRATHQGEPSHNTAIGHSYGTTVVGHAARDEHLAVDDIVFVASPGVGVDQAAKLGLPPGHVHATVDAHDPIQLTPVHGIEPQNAGFDANVFTSGPTDPAQAIAGQWYADRAHSMYWDPGNKALDNMGRIIAGQPTY